MVLICSYGPDIDFTVEKVRNYQTPHHNFLMRTSEINNVLERVETDHCGEGTADLASTMRAPDKKE